MARQRSANASPGPEDFEKVRLLGPPYCTRTTTVGLRRYNIERGGARAFELYSSVRVQL